MLVHHRPHECTHTTLELPTRHLMPLPMNHPATLEVSHLVRRRPLTPCRAVKNNAYSGLTPLTVRLSRTYTHTSDTQEEAYQEAHIGLLRAYRSFDITRGSFPAYAQSCGVHRRDGLSPTRRPHPHPHPHLHSTAK